MPALALADSEAASVLLALGSFAQSGPSVDAVVTVNWGLFQPTSAIEVALVGAVSFASVLSLWDTGRAASL